MHCAISMVSHFFQDHFFLDTGGVHAGPEGNGHFLRTVKRNLELPHAPPWATGERKGLGKVTSVPIYSRDG